MRTLTGYAAISFALVFAACSDGADDGPAGGTAGSAGSAGSSGTGGAAAAAGASGEAGTAGSSQAPEIPMTRSSAPHDDSPDVDAADYASFVSGTNAFGLDLFHAMAGDENTFLSPTSTVIALAMTYGGARGNTAVQMAEAMHSTLEPAVFHAAVNQLTIDLESRNIAPHDTDEGEKSVRLSPVNGVFAQQGHDFLGDYLDLLSVNYDAGVFQMDFAGDPAGSRDTINEWVAFYTADRIDELLSEQDIKPTTRLVLANALYFYGSWMYAFNEDETSDATFRTLGGTDVTVPTMRGSLYVPYADGDGYQIVELPYDGEKVSMTIVLPDEGRFEEIRSGLTAGWLKSARAGMTPDTGVHLSLPKFSFSWGSESFADALQQMGMVDAFVDGVADFSGMDGTTNLFIQDVVHQAFVGVDEHGTEAAAATAVIVGFNSAPELEVTVDRPFLFFITDDTGATLFVGQVADPSA